MYYDHIGVVFRGHIRTWRYIYPAVFDFWEKIAKNVDYYFVTYEYDHWYISMVEESFKGKNLIKLLVITKLDKFYNSGQAPARMNYEIVPYKRKRERDVKYTAFFDTRPDVLYSVKNNLRPISFQPNTVYTSGFCLQKSHKDNIEKIAIDDHFIVSTGNIYDELSMRYIDIPLNGIQIDYVKTIYNYGYNLSLVDWVEAAIIRPNCKLIYPDPHDVLSMNGPNPGEIADQWCNMPAQEKIELLEREHIHLDDYKTDCAWASI